MMNIRIKKLALENFKCHKSLTIDFEGRNASIYGDNATGKTSIYDALVWLLFSKDSHGNGEKNIEIKPLNENGEVRDHMAITSVEAVLLLETGVNGAEVTLKRTLQEVWSTKRGHTEPTYDGNTSEYYINGVPVKKYAFSEYVDKLVDEDTFRMLTSVSHFAEGISWQERRAVLFKVAGVLDDATIMATDARFLPLSEGMGKLTLDDYKKKLLADKKRYVGAKSEIPARISECEKTIEDVEGLDFEAARIEIAYLTSKKEGYEGEVMALENDVAASNKRVEIKQAQIELDELDSKNRIHRESQTASAVDIPALNRDLARYQAKVKTNTTILDGQKTRLRDVEYNITASRDRWYAVNAETFTGGVCPLHSVSMGVSSAMRRFRWKISSGSRAVFSSWRS